MKLSSFAILSSLIGLFCLVSLPLAHGADLKVGDAAPLFTLKNQEGADFSLADRKGKGWTVLFFYPKAGTPGCTKEVCAFRDALDKIKALNAEVFGISADTVEEQKNFHREHALRFDLLADSEMNAIRSYNAKMPILSMAKRWTFIIDPDLKIRSFEPDVDPMLDAARVEKELRELQGAAR
jgi:peroxiredoxin Q/BCP